MKQIFHFTFRFTANLNIILAIFFYCFIFSTKNSYGQNCPSDPQLVLNQNDFCSGDTILLSGIFGMTGDLTGTIQVTEASGALGDIELDVPFILPSNTGCDPVAYSLVAGAICEDGSTIPGAAEALVKTIVAYPEYNPDLVVIIPGGCGVGNQLTTTCPNYDIQVIDGVTIPDLGQTGYDTWTVNYIPVDSSVTPCFGEQSIELAYSCQPPCPSAPTLTVDQTVICSGESISLFPSFALPGELGGFFEIIEANGIISDIPIDTAFYLPINDSCDPVTYTFIANAYCEDGSVIPPPFVPPVVDVTVYPEFNENLISINEGNCDTPGTITPLCPNYTVTPEYPEVPPPHPYFSLWRIDYNDPASNGVTCIVNQLIEAPNSCYNQCPEAPSISTNQSSFCSGESITIEGSFEILGEELGGTITIQEISNSIQNIETGVPFELPINSDCNPITYTFIGNALCDDGTFIPGSTEELALTVTVYPEFNENLLVINHGDCNNPPPIPSLTSTCTNYMLNENIPSPENPSWLVTYNDSISCFSEIVEIPVPTMPCYYDSICPAQPKISSSLLVACSGESVSIDGSFGILGEETGIITITETSGSIRNIEAGVPFELPINSGCDPITYTFVGEALCADGSVIPGTTEDLTTTITVYPDYNPNLIYVIEGRCHEAGYIGTDCDNYEVQPIGEEATIPEFQEEGTDLWLIRGVFPDSTITCFTTNIAVPYSCGPDCPAEPQLVTSHSVACSRDSIILDVIFGIPGERGYGSITETSGAISDITAGVPFALPINNGCDPITYTFIANPLCSTPHAPLLEIPGREEDLTVTVTVYPEFSEDLIVIQPGNCGLASQVTSSCQHYQLDVYLCEPAPCMYEDWTISYTLEDAPSSCFEPQLIQVSTNCPSGCPKEPQISLSQSPACSGESITIEGIFAIPGGEAGTINIQEATGVISNIEAGVPFELPINNGCDPITYTFVGEAICEDGSVIPGSNADLTKTVTVYPEFNEDLISITHGNCSSPGEILSSCPNYDFRVLSCGPSGDCTIQPWAVNYILNDSSISCFGQPTVYTLIACANVCPMEPIITSNQSIACSRESIIIDGSFGISGEEFAGTITVQESTGSINNIELGVPFELPINNGCDPITYTFTGEAVCENGDPILGFVENLITTVTVYPEFSESFLDIRVGKCNEAGVITALCDKYILTPPANPTIPTPGEVGSDIWLASYPIQDSLQACIEGFIIEVPYACDFPIGFEAVAKEAYIHLYPNPVLTGHTIYLETQLSDNTSYNYQITDIYGRQILPTQAFIANQKVQTIELPKVPVGIYFLEVYDEQRKRINTQKISIH